MLTGKSSLETAVAALRHGAFDYLTKPCKLVELRSAAQPRGRKARADEQVPGASSSGWNGSKARADLIGAVAAMEQVRTLIAKVAPTELHRADPRRNRHRQGAGRPGRARSEPAGRDAVRGDQLRGLARKPDRKRAVRPSQGSVHRGRRASRRACSRWPTAARCSWTRSASCPRRCRPSCCGSWKAARSAAWARTNRSPVDVRVVCATHRHLEEMVERRRVPRRPDVPHQHVRDPPAAAARADRRHPAAGPAPARRGSAAARGRDDELFTPEALAALCEHTLAGQRPRAGQRDRARHDPLRRRADRGSSTCRAVRRAPRGAAPASTLKAVPGGPQTLREIEMQVIYQTLERLRRQQAEGGRRAGHQPEDALQQAQPVERLTRAVGLTSGPFSGDSFDFSAISRKIERARRVLQLRRNCRPRVSTFAPTLPFVKTDGR